MGTTLISNQQPCIVHACLGLDYTIIPRKMGVFPIDSMLSVDAARKPRRSW